MLQNGVRPVRAWGVTPLGMAGEAGRNSPRLLRLVHSAGEGPAPVRSAWQIPLGRDQPPYALPGRRSGRWYRQLADEVLQLMRLAVGDG